MIAQKPEEPELYLSEIQRRRLRRRRMFLGLAVFILFYLLALGFLWVVLWTPIFRLKSFEIMGTSGVPKEDLVNLLRWQVMDAGWKHVFGFDNIFVWPESLPSEKLKYLPVLKSLEIHRDYWEKAIQISVLERTPFGIWCLMKREAPECFWFDEEGVILARAPLAEGSLIPAVNDYSQNKLGIGAAVLSQDQIPNLFSVFRVLAAAKVEVKEIRLEDTALAEIKVLTYGGLPVKAGPELYFSLRFPADNTLAVLNSMRAATSTAGFERLEYIDFRVENRAYYK